MQINSIQFDAKKCPKPCNTGFGSRLGTRAQRALTRAERDLFASAAEQLQKLNSDLNRMTYEHALDFRQSICKAARQKINNISKALSIVTGK